MFSIGDNVVYGSEGVYTVCEFTSSPIDKNDTRQFYLLRPVQGPAGNVIITPVDNENVKMRAVMSYAEALEFIDTIPDIPTISIEKEKNRREVYRQTIANASCEDFVSIIKTVMERREEMLKAKRRLSESDHDYEKKAKLCLGGELAIALGIPFDAVEEFILARLSTAV